MAKKLLIAGGGTGGHIFPGIAIAEEWRRRGGEVVFVGTPRGQEGAIVPRHGFVLRLMKVGALKGAGVLRKFATLAGLPLALFRALGILRREKPDAVLGIGGYASGPVCVAAALTGRDTAITDQNAHPGFTNRVLGRIVRRVFLSFEKSAAFFKTSKTVVTGNPVRSQIVWTPYRAPTDELRIFVFGGSQGAVALNDNFTKGLERVREFWPRLSIVHQAGDADLAAVKKFYEERGVTATVSRFFDDMDAIYRRAHVVFCRAGAGTVTELALSGRPAVLVPYPFAADNHQLRNAEEFAGKGAAWLVEQKDFTPEWVEEKIRFFFAHPEELAARAEKMRALARPDAASRIVDDLMGRTA